MPHWRDIGPVQFPSFPVAAAMTDRDDGNLWHLKVRASDERMLLTDQFENEDLTHRVIFGPFDGPWLNSSQVRLFVRGGRLGYEFLPDEKITQRWRRVFARLKSSQRTAYRLQTPAGFTGSEALAYELVT